MPTAMFDAQLEQLMIFTIMQVVIAILPYQLKEFNYSLGPCCTAQSQHCNLLDYSALGKVSVVRCCVQAGGEVTQLARVSCTDNSSLSPTLSPLWPVLAPLLKVSHCSSTQVPPPPASWRNMIDHRSCGQQLHPYSGEGQGYPCSLSSECQQAGVPPYYRIP